MGLVLKTKGNEYAYNKCTVTVLLSTVLSEGYHKERLTLAVRLQYVYAV